MMKLSVMRRSAALFGVFSLCVMGAILFFGGCSKADYASARQKSFASSEMASAEITANMTDGSWAGFNAELGRPIDTVAQQSDVNRKLAVSASLHLRLTEMEGADQKMADIVRMYNGYTASSSVNENHSRYELKIPASSYQNCLVDLQALGRVLYYSETSEDVTTQYYDLESAITTQRELLKTFQAYLSKAVNIEEIMTVERRIAELQSELDFTGTRFKALSNRVDYATIEVSVQGPDMPSAGDPTFGERVSGLLRVFGDYASTVALFLLGLVVYGVPSILILVFLYWLLFGKIGLLKKLLRFAGSGKKEK